MLQSQQGKSPLSVTRPISTGQYIWGITYWFIIHVYISVLRSDGLPLEKIALPTDRPFVLLRHKRGCQHVHGMDVTEESITWDTEDSKNDNRITGDHPYEDGHGHIRLHFCLYQREGTFSFSSVVG